MTPSLRPAGLLLTEQDRHKQAFELYRSQGARRSYAQVASALGVSASAVKLWSRSFGWGRRLQELEAHEVNQKANQVMSSRLEVIHRNLKIVRAALLRTAREVAQGRVKAQMGDLDRLIRLEEYLHDQAPASEDPHPDDDAGYWCARAVEMARRVIAVHPAGRDMLRELITGQRDDTGRPIPGRVPTEVADSVPD